MVGVPQCSLSLARGTFERQRTKCRYDGIQVHVVSTRTSAVLAAYCRVVREKSLSCLLCRTSIPTVRFPTASESLTSRPLRDPTL